jgi:hypothetical protein
LCQPAPRGFGIHERGVVLALDAGRARALPEPSDNPAMMETTAEDLEPDDLGDKLRRAWDLLSGNY